MVKKHQLLAYMIIAFIIASCSSLENSVNTIPPSTKLVRPSETINVAPLKTSTLPATLPATYTPNATKPTPTWIIEGHPDLPVVYYSESAVTDGNLFIGIGILGRSCYHRGETIYIDVYYKNLTIEDLVLVDFDYISRKQTLNAYGQLYPIMTTLDNKEVYPDVFFLQGDAINPRSPFVQVLPLRSLLHFIGTYEIPKEIGKEGKEHNITFLPLPSGKYLLKFVYIANEYQGSWYGAISSNQVEICVSE